MGPYETGFAPDAAAARRARSAAALRTQLETLQTETVTGQAADPATRLRGQTAEALRLGASLDAIAGYREAGELAAARAATQQTTIATVRSAVESLGSDVQSALDTAFDLGVALTEKPAENALETVVSALNTAFAGRMLFSGNAGTTPALADAETIATAVGVAAATGTTAATADAAVRALFDTPGGDFETTFYTGGTGDAPATAIAEGETVRITLRADEQVFRDILREISAIGAAVAAPGTVEERRALAEAGLEGLRNTLAPLASVAGQIGVTEARIEEVQTRSRAEETVLNDALTALVGRDQFEAASALTATEDAIEALFVTTARISNLTLTNFLR
ncbi:MAG: hypothetical protein AAF675_03080 [Pseudomonadota bacterium]